MDLIILLAGAIFLFSILASKISSRLGVPALLLFLGLGMLIGSDGPGGIPFDQADQAQSLGVVALIFILFSGGLETEWPRIRPVLRQGISLSTLGVLFSTTLMAAFSHYALGFHWKESLLLGAMISSTDAAALFSVMKAQGIILKGNLNSLLEFESGTNDPMAVFLTVSLVEMCRHPGFHLLPLLWLLVLEMVTGLILGYLCGVILVFLTRKLKLPCDGLYQVLVVAMVLLSYGAAATLKGSGFLAVYITGIVFGNARSTEREKYVPIYDAIAWLMQISMFLVLGLLSFPKQLPPVMSTGFILALVLCFVARPLSVFLSLALSKTSWKEKLLISWVGLRGAVPIILATFPLLADLPESWTYFHIVFFIVLTSVTLQGLTIPWLAKTLSLQEQDQGPGEVTDS